MPRHAKKNSPGTKRGGEGVPTAGTKLDLVSPEGSTKRKGGNPGGTNEAGDHQVQGASHQGSSLGKRNSG